MLDGRKSKSVSAKIKRYTRLHTSTTVIHYSSVSFKLNQRNTNGKGRSQIIPVCKWHDPFCRVTIRFEEYKKGRLKKMPQGNCIGRPTSILQEGWKEKKYIEKKAER